MSNTEVLLAGILWMLVIIWIYVRWIYLKVQYGSFYDPNQSVNAYGENLTDALQNSIERGHRGISTYG